MNIDNKLINGVEGVVTATVDGKVIELGELTKIEASAEKIKSEYRVLGDRATHTKANGWKGTGSMTIRYGTSFARNLMLDYIKTGKDAQVSITVINDDPNFEGGAIKTKLSGVNIDSALLTKLDVDTDILDEDVNFTFTDVENL